MAPHCYSISSFVQRSGDGDAKLFMYFYSLHASYNFSILVISLMQSVDFLEL
jgi:hypothetical protein